MTTTPTPSCPTTALKPVWPVPSRRRAVLRSLAAWLWPLSSALLPCLALPVGAQPATNVLDQPLLAPSTNALPALATNAPPPAGTALATNSPSAGTVIDLRSARHFSLNDPPELKWGPAVFHPRLTTSLTYDDNILIQKTNRQSDFITTVMPALAVIAGDVAPAQAKYLTAPQLLRQTADTWPSLYMAADYGPRPVFFLDHDNNNSLDHAALLNVVWPSNPLLLGLNLNYDLLNTTVIDAQNRTQVETYSALLTAGYKISSRTSAELNLRLYSVGYALSGLNGYRDWSAPLWFNYRSSDRLIFGAGLTPGYVSVADNFPQTYERPLLRAQYMVGERTDAELAAGGEFRQFRTGVSDLAEPYFGLTLSHRPSLRTSLSATGFRQGNTSVNNGYNYVATGLSLGARQGIGRTFALNLLGTYQHLEYLHNDQIIRADRSDDFFSVQTGFDLKLAKYSSLALFYLYRQHNSSAFAGFDNNQIAFSLTLGL